MARDLNKVFLIGRLGTDAELRRTPSGKATATFRLAVGRRTRRDGEGREQPEEADWFTVVLWERLAEIGAQYLGKGSRVHVEGRLRVRSFETQEGQRRTVTEVVASELIMLDARHAERTPAIDEAEDSDVDPDVDDADVPF